MSLCCVATFPCHSCREGRFEEATSVCLFNVLQSISNNRVGKYSGDELTSGTVALRTIDANQEAAPTWNWDQHLGIGGPEAQSKSCWAEARWAHDLLPRRRSKGAEVSEVSAVLARCMSLAPLPH